MGKNGAGVIAYTKDGYILIAYENVYIWSFPKGHRIENQDYKEPWIENAEREFREETNFPKPIQLNEEEKTRAGNTYLYFYNMENKEDRELLQPDGHEVLALLWIHIDDLFDFSLKNRVNNTISKLDVEKFKKITRVKNKPKPLNPFVKEFVPQSKSKTYTKSSYAILPIKIKKIKTGKKSSKKNKKSVRKSRRQG